MRSLYLKLLGGLFLLLGFLLWISGGARSGFYKTSHTEMKLDELLGFEYPEIRDVFLFGVEPLALGFLLFAGLSVASLALSRRS